MHDGDDPLEPLSTPGPGRTREAFGWMVFGCGVLCFTISIALAVLSVANWFTGR